MRTHLTPYALRLDGVELNPITDGGGVEFVFPELALSKRPASWGQRLCYGTGVSYLSGIAIGTSWGIWEGLRSPHAITARLKLNSVLNSVTRRGPFLGNSLAVLGAWTARACEPAGRPCRRLRWAPTPHASEQR